MKRRREPESRKLLDLWAAPANAGEPVAVLATSFTFDNEFFESQCLARFAGIEGRTGDGADREYLIELETKLAEISASVLIDRGSSCEGHPLRFDVVPIAVRDGLLHAKVALLVWRGWVRLLVGSSNLTPAGYRRQIESMTVFDAFASSEVPRSLFAGAISELAAIVAMASPDNDTAGPKQRAEAILATARSELSRIDLRSDWSGRLQCHVRLSRPGRPALNGLEAVWKGGPPRRAVVFSPFFDSTADSNRAFEALVGRLARRGKRRVSVALPVREINSKSVVCAPASLRSAAPEGVDVEFRAFEAGEDLGDAGDSEDRRLHAKGILLQSATWVAALLGSSNFTVAGLGIDRRRGHVEMNAALGAPRDSPEGAALRELFKRVLGTPFDLDQVVWEAQADDEEEQAVPLPLGFVRAVVEPSPPPTIILDLDADSLPARWRIEIEDGGTLVDANEYDDRARLELPSPSKRLSLALEVHWEDRGEWRSTAWPLNVTDRTKLPPPDELRNLTADEILEILASMRPMHEALVAVLKAREATARAGKPGADPELDPLKKHASPNLLFARTRAFSNALGGLKRQISLPASSLDALQWRLETSPWSPRALAQKLHEEALLPGALDGETAFRLAELARTLGTIDWRTVTRGLGGSASKSMIEAVLAQLRTASVPETADPRLTRYIREALQGGEDGW